MLMSISGDTLEAPLLCAGYRQTDGVYDEMSAAPGVLRPHWDTFIGSMSALGGEELARRWKIARQRIRENGVTYNVYGDPLGMDRPWNLDSIPLLILRRSARNGPPVESGFHPSPDSAVGVECTRSGPDTARASPELHPGGPLRPATTAPRRPSPAGAGIRQPRLLAAVSRHAHRGSSLPALARR